MFGLSTTVYAENFKVKHNLDIINKKETPLHALHSITVLSEAGKNLYFGQSLYSAILGDAGGLFIGGFELSKKTRMKDYLSFEIGMFLGGGGGAAIVPGNGMMEKYFINFNQELSEKYIGSIGFSYLNITGSNISSGTLSFGISKNQNYALVLGHVKENINSGRILTSVKPLIKQFLPGKSLKRNGRSLKKMSLMGLEATFTPEPYALFESFVQTTGAVGGDGEGYADILFGLRQHMHGANLKSFVEVSAGFGGGGEVDTGGGLLGSLGLGLSLPIIYGNKLELGVQKITTLDGELNSISPFVRTAIIFNKKKNPYSVKRKWQLSFGITNQLANNGYRKAGITETASPSLIENSIDLFLNDNIYLIGNAQTVFSGNAGGYAVGLLGIGYSQPISDLFSYSVEIQIGAAAGGGINTEGGMVKAAKLEIDYNLKDNLAFSIGVGKLSTLNSENGFDPSTLHVGLKYRFTTFH